MPSASAASRHSHPRIAAATAGSDRASAARRRRARGDSVPSAYCAASASRRAERSGRTRFIAVVTAEPALEALPEPLEAAPDPGLHGAERLAQVRARARRATAPGRTRARSPASGRLRAPRRNRAPSALRRPRAAARPASVPSAGSSISVSSSSSRVSVTVSGSRRRSWSRQRLRTMLASHVCGFALRRGVASRVVPDADEGLLQQVLGGRRFPQDTQRDAHTDATPSAGRAPRTPPGRRAPCARAARRGRRCGPDRRCGHQCAAAAMPRSSVRRPCPCAPSPQHVARVPRRG